MSSNLNPSPSGALPSPQQLETAPETRITTPEEAAILHITPQTTLSRAASGKLPAKIPDDMPFTYDEKQNYLIHLEGQPQKAPFEYLQKVFQPAMRSEPGNAKELFGRCMALRISGCSTAYTHRPNDPAEIPELRESSRGTSQTRSGQRHFPGDTVQALRKTIFKRIIHALPGSGLPAAPFSENHVPLKRRSDLFPSSRPPSALLPEQYLSGTGSSQRYPLFGLPVPS